MSSWTCQVFSQRHNNKLLVAAIQSSDELAATLATPHLVVLMFWAPWSVPCRVMRRPFINMARVYREHAVFCKVNVDSFKDVAEQYGVEALPMFVLMKNNQVQGRVIGVKEGELKSTIEQNI